MDHRTTEFASAVSGHPAGEDVAPAPFDPSDPCDAMSEMFRRQVTDVALSAYQVTLYRDLNTQQQLECFLAGALTGIVGVCLASIKSDGADAMMEYIASCLPVARVFAESIADENGKSVLNHHDNAPGT